MRTVVCQSHRERDRPPWIDACLSSVRDWAAGRGWSYRFRGDDLFELAPYWFRTKAGRLTTVTDLARLLWLRDLLSEGWERVIWMDADVLVFAPAAVDPALDGDHAFGREVWVQRDSAGKLKAYRNVHNAYCRFSTRSPVLDFLIHASLSVVRRAEAPLAPQALGPKLLGALHSIVGFPLVDSVGAFSPLVLADLAAGGGPALKHMADRTTAPLGAANLCASLSGGERDEVHLDEALYARAIEALLSTGGTVVGRQG